jgi:hypothetical protein
LVAYLVEAKGCEASQTLDQETGRLTDQPKTKGHCCPEIDINCSTFFQLYLADQKSPQKAMMETLGLLTGLVSAAKSTFNVFDPNVVPYSSFIGLDPERAQSLAKSVNVNLQVVQDASVQTPLSPYAEIFSKVLLRPNDTMIVTTAIDNEQKQTVAPLTITPTSVLLDLGQSASIAGTTGKPAGDTSPAAAQAQIEQLTAALAEKDKQIASVEDMVTQLTTRVAALEKPTKRSQGA